MKYKISFFTLCIFLIFSNLPVAAQEIVNTTKTYTYEEMITDIEELKDMYPKIMEYKTIGTTKYNRDIIAVKLGKGETQVFISGSTHAREWITTVLNMKMIEEYARSYEEDKMIYNVRVRDLLNETSIWFVPMINPDGVTLQQKGLTAFPKSTHSSLIKMNGGSSDFTRWKNNAEGIDLNRQYPPSWNDTSSVNQPSWKEYKGDYAFQTNEAQALRDFTYEIEPKNVIAYHSSGNVLFWIDKYNKPEEYRTAQKFSNITNYPMRKHLPYRGYTEWFVQEFSGIGFTPELSVPVGDRHVPLTTFPDIWERNKDIGIWLTAETYQNEQQKQNVTSTEGEVVLNEEHQLYSKPSFFEVNKETVQPGTFVTTEQINNWYRIQTPGNEAWILQPSEVKVNTPPKEEETEQPMVSSPKEKEPLKLNIPIKEFAPYLIIGGVILLGILYFVFLWNFLERKRRKYS